MANANARTYVHTCDSDRRAERLRALVCARVLPAPGLATRPPRPLARGAAAWQSSAPSRVAPRCRCRRQAHATRRLTSPRDPPAFPAPPLNGSQALATKSCGLALTVVMIFQSRTPPPAQRSASTARPRVPPRPPRPPPRGARRALQLSARWARGRGQQERRPLGPQARSRRQRGCRSASSRVGARGRPARPTRLPRRRRRRRPPRPPRHRRQRRRRQQRQAWCQQQRQWRLQQQHQQRQRWHPRITPPRLHPAATQPPLQRR